jgi:hypothetical protein
MVQEIIADNVPQAYHEALWKIGVCGKMEESRNGPVLSMQEPTILTIYNPLERVLFDQTRRANPFFHVMEFVWMMAGSNDAHWISQFNKRMMEYADNGVLRGAYGWRWANSSPQIQDTIRLLRASPKTRQAVISMWDPIYDGFRAKTSDRPCNTHLYLRIIDGKLNMTVCNRSNDVVWGMLGSNVVHFTMLQEFIALAVGVEIGVYRVFTNNLHFYLDMPRAEEIMLGRTEPDDDRYGRVSPFPLLDPIVERWSEFQQDAHTMVNNDEAQEDDFKTEWFQSIALPMHDYYLTKDGYLIEIMPKCDWKEAARDWHKRTSSRN